MSKQFLNKFNVKVLKQKYYFAIIILLHGEIAQLASAIGSYPIGRGFESPSRYQFCSLTRNS